MAIELILEGQLEKEKDREVFSEMVKEICEEKKIKIEDYDTSLIMDVCPEGYIECSYEGVFISMVAQTNVAGPGFHAFVAQFYDDIMMKSGISFEVGDATQYYENRDFESLKYKYFYPWLTQICEYIKEQGEHEKDMCICWPIEEYRPASKEGYVVTPLGYRNIEDFKIQDIEQLAQQFFIWNHPVRDASYYKNCALALLWKECYFEYSTMNDHTSKIANMCIDYIEAAYDADSTITLPYDIYEVLCNTLRREIAIHIDNEVSENNLIGYRKGMIFYPLGNWQIAVQGFQEKTFDDVMKTMNIMAPYREEGEPWTWLIKANIVEITQEQTTWMCEHESYYTLDHEDVKLQGVVLQEEGYYRLLVIAKKEEESLQLDCFIREQKDIEKVKKWCHSVRYADVTQPTIKH